MSKPNKRKATQSDQPATGADASVAGVGMATIDDTVLAQLVRATYQPLDQHPHQAKLHATITPHGPGVGHLRADIIKPVSPDDLYIVAIRGTQGTGNWLANLDARLVPSTQLDASWDGSDRPKVHAGFARASEAMTPVLATQVPPGARVILAGHSLGAAIAVFLAPRLRDRGITIERVVTFGCPRVGDAFYREAWHNTVAAPIRRYVNGPDPVCQLPTPWRGFCHIGDLRWYSYQGKQMDAGPWMRFGNRLGAYWSAWRTKGSDLLHYHDMARYVALLQG